MSEHKTNSLSTDRVTREYAESHQWWADFLAARSKAIDAMEQLGKDDPEIMSRLNIDDLAHLDRIMSINKYRS